MSGVSFAAVAALVRELSEEEQTILLSSDKRPNLKLFLQNQVDYPLDLEEGEFKLGHLLRQTRLKADSGFKSTPYEFEKPGRNVFRVIGFNQKVTTDEANEELDRLDLVPAREDELVAFFRVHTPPMYKGSPVYLVAMAEYRQEGGKVYLPMVANNSFSYVDASNLWPEYRTRFLARVK